MHHSRSSPLPPPQRSLTQFCPSRRSKIVEWTVASIPTGTHASPANCLASNSAPSVPTERSIPVPRTAQAIQPAPTLTVRGDDASTRTSAECVGASPRRSLSDEKTEETVTPPGIGHDPRTGGIEDQPRCEGGECHLPGGMMRGGRSLIPESYLGTFCLSRLSPITTSGRGVSAGC